MEGNVLWAFRFFQLDISSAEILGKESYSTNLLAAFKHLPDLISYPNVHVVLCFIIILGKIVFSGKFRLQKIHYNCTIIAACT